MRHITHTHTHTTQPFYGSIEFVQDNPGELVPEETFTHYTHRGHQSSLSAFSIYYDRWHPPYSIHVLYSLFPQCLSKFSLVYLLARYPQLYTPYISSPNHCLLFAAHAHTIATCSTEVLRLCPLIPVSLSNLYLELYLVTSHHTSILPFASLTSEVPPHVPFLQAKSHFHATYCFAHNCCTISLSLSMIYTYW